MMGDVDEGLLEFLLQCRGYIRHREAESRCSTALREILCVVTFFNKLQGEEECVGRLKIP